MQVNPSPIKMLILDTADNVTEAFVDLLHKQKLSTVSERFNDKAALFDALRSRQWDFVLLNGAATELEGPECARFIRQESVNTSLLLLQQGELSIAQVAQAEKGGMAALVSLDMPEYSVIRVRQELEAIQLRREHLNLQEMNAELDERCQLLLSSSRDAIAYIHEGMHIYANLSYQSMFGCEDMDDVISIPFVDMAAAADRIDLKTTLKNMQSQGADSEDRGEGQVLALNLLDKEGQKFPAELHLKPTWYEGENCLQVVVIRKEEQQVDTAGGDEGSTLPAEPVTEVRAETELVHAEVSATEERVAPTAVTDSVGLAVTDEDEDEQGSMLLREKINAALAADQLELFYQPVIATADIEPEFYDIETVIPAGQGRRLTSAGLSKDIATGPLSQKLDQWAFGEALRVMAELYKQGQPLQFLMRVTAQSIRDKGFIEWLLKQIAEQHLGGHVLVLNLREQDVIENQAHAEQLASGLRDAGIRICISDYSDNEAISAFISQHRVSLVRLAEQTVEQLVNAPGFAESLKKMVALLHRNKTRVIATGVVNTAILGSLWTADVDLVQGSYFQSEPMKLHVNAFSDQMEVLRNVV